MSFQILTAIK